MKLTLYKLSDGNRAVTIPTPAGNVTMFSSVYNYDPAHICPYNALSEAVSDHFGITLPAEHEIKWDVCGTSTLTVEAAAKTA